MPQSYFELEAQLKKTPHTWLVTGAAGFIGSHLCQRLLSLGQAVIGLDNFATGSHANIEAIRTEVGQAASRRFTFIEADVGRADVLAALPEDVGFVLHQAALGSVPRSIEKPLASHQANVDGFVSILEFCRNRKIPLVYASSSSVYGDHPSLPKIEGSEGNLLSPYAATKAINELYADVWHRTYQLPLIGLRYFNVFGPRQDPRGAYAAVIPRWLSCVQDCKSCLINGDGQTSRDFCYIENVIQANILSACAEPEAFGRVYNIACGERTTLRELHDLLWQFGKDFGLCPTIQPPVLQDFRAGDVRHSLADVSLAQQLLGYRPAVSFVDGLRALVRTAAGMKS
jgi:UDP-N-acetylglucosamine 4-epimerase